MRQHFGCLRFGQSVVHRAIEVIGDLRGLAGCDKRAHRDKAPVAGRESRTQPQFAKQQVRRVLRDAGSDLSDVLLNVRGAVCLGGFIERQKLRRNREAGPVRCRAFRKYT